MQAPGDDVGDTGDRLLRQRLLRYREGAAPRISAGKPGHPPRSGGAASYLEPGQVATANTDCPNGAPRLPSRRLRTGTK